jgi:hypothetical protein
MVHSLPSALLPTQALPLDNTSRTTAGKCHHLVGKVVVTIECLDCVEDIWKAMTSEQKVQVLSLCKSKSARHTVKVMNNAGPGPTPMDVSDQLATLMHTI